MAANAATTKMEAMRFIANSSSLPGSAHLALQYRQQVLLGFLELGLVSVMHLAEEGGAIR
jgi:hypothetical protein